MLVLDCEFRPDQIADNAHGEEAKFRILLGFGEFDGFLEARPAEFLKLVPLLPSWEPSDAYRHLIGEHETLDGAVKIGV